MCPTSYLGSVLIVILAAVVGVAGCASSADGAEAGNDALSAGPDGTSRGADAGAPAIPTLHATGGSLAVVEVVAVEDAEPMSDDGTAGAARARLVFSSQTGICNRLDSGYVLGSSEKVLSVWVEGSSFATGTTMLGGTAQTAGGCSFVDQASLCSVDVGAAEPVLGAGSIDLTAVGTSVTGSVDVTVNGLHLTGSFVARTCPAAKKTLGTAICVDPHGKSTTDVGAGPDYARTDPDP
jgi:hypothetical protein